MGSASSDFVLFTQSPTTQVIQHQKICLVTQLEVDQVTQRHSLLRHEPVLWCLIRVTHQCLGLHRQKYTYIFEEGERFVDKLQ